MEGGIKKFSVCVDIAFVLSLIRTNKRDFSLPNTYFCLVFIYSCSSYLLLNASFIASCLWQLKKEKSITANGR